MIRILSNKKCDPVGLGATEPEEPEAELAQLSLHHFCSVELFPDANGRVAPANCCHADQPNTEGCWAARCQGDRTLTTLAFSLADRQLLHFVFPFFLSSLSSLFFNVSFCSSIPLFSHRHPSISHLLFFFNVSPSIFSSLESLSLPRHYHPLSLSLHCSFFLLL